MISEIFELKPRWPGAPKICVAMNLPAFKTKDEALAFHHRNAPGSQITSIFECVKCDCWHYEIKPRPPSGDSSGSSRR